MQAPGCIKETTRKCDMCCLEFDSVTQLLLHQKQKHNENTCSFCGFVATSCNLLRGHVKRLHSGSSPHVCVCLEKFTCDRDLKEHTSMCLKILNSQLSAVERSIGLPSFDPQQNGLLTGCGNPIELPLVSLMGPAPSVVTMVTDPIQQPSLAGQGPVMSRTCLGGSDSHVCTCQQTFASMEDLMEHAIYCLKPTTASNGESQHKEDASNSNFKTESITAIEIGSFNTPLEVKGESSLALPTTIVRTASQPSFINKPNGSNSSTTTVERTTKIGGSTKWTHEGNPKKDSTAGGSTQLTRDYQECKLMPTSGFGSCQKGEPFYVKCSICYMNFKNQESLQEHYQVRHREGGPFCCPSCGVAFSTTVSLEHHACGAEEEDECAQFCVDCGMSLHGLDAKEHAMEHSRLIKACYVCFVCNWVTDDADRCLFHKRSTSCFNRSRQAIRLTAQSAPQDHVVSICALCGLLLTSNFNFTRHLHAMHSHTQLYQCGMCGLLYKQRRQVAQHQLHCQAERITQRPGTHRVSSGGKLGKVLKIHMRKLPFIYL